MTKINLSATNIELFYEFDPFFERTPSFGEPCEIEKVDMLDDGTILYKCTSRIVQNHHHEEYAYNALKKGVRTVVKLPETTSSKLITYLKEKGIGKVVEFHHYQKDGKDYLVENTLKKDIEEPSLSL